MWADVLVFTLGLLVMVAGSIFGGYLWGYGAAIERHKLKIFGADKQESNCYDGGN